MIYGECIAGPGPGYPSYSQYTGMAAPRDTPCHVHQTEEDTDKGVWKEEEKHDFPLHED